jgi:hypothetical protein
MTVGLQNARRPAVSEVPEIQCRIVGRGFGDGALERGVVARGQSGLRRKDSTAVEGVLRSAFGARCAPGFFVGRARSGDRCEAGLRR